MKDILGFKIELNGELVSVAGIENSDYGVVICILNSVKREFDHYEGVELHLSGLNSAEQNHLKWETKSLNEGDVVSVEVVKPPFDKPMSKKSMQKSEEEIIQDKLKRYHKLKEELKGYL